MPIDERFFIPEALSLCVLEIFAMKRNFMQFQRIGIANCFVGMINSA